MMIVWIISIIATMIIAAGKNLGVGGYFVLSLFTGPLAVIIVLLVSPRIMNKADDNQDIKKELSDLRHAFFMLQQKVNSLEILIRNSPGQETNVEIKDIPKVEVADEPLYKNEFQQMEKRVSLQKQVVDARVEENLGVKEKAVETQSAATSSKGTDLEINFGRNWLNKIGIVIFTLGMGFLISYTFKYFGPFFKIVFGYLVSAVLFFIGFKLETKEKFVNFGRALLGGGWALVYFTTYAMHHFEASRLIPSQLLDLCLLALVIIGMMAHVLRYKSESVMSIALFVAYITATLGQITIFTVVSCLLLAVVILFLVYKFQWVKTFILGMMMTYGVHYFWVMPNIGASIHQDVIWGISTPDYYLMMNFIFLTSYWLVFIAGIHVAKSVKESRVINILAAANFGNISLYSVLSYPIILKLFYSQRFTIVLGTGILYLMLSCLMKRAGRQKLYMSDVVAAVFALTFSISLKFLSTPTLLLWLIEIPFLLFISIHFKEKIFRYLSYALTVYVGLRLIILSISETRDIYFLGLIWTQQEFLSFWAVISMAACFYLTRHAKKHWPANRVDEVFDHVFPALSFSYLTFLIFSFVKQPWITFVLSLEGIGLLTVSVLLALMRFRIYAYLVLAGAAVTFMMENIYTSSNVLKWFIISSDVFIFFGAYFVMKHFHQTKRINVLFDQEEALVFGAGIGMLIFAIFQYIDARWISLTLGISGVVIIGIGILNKDKIERWGGLMLFGLTLGRVILVELAGLDIIFKIITFIVLGLLFLGISFMYNRFNMDQIKK